MAIVAVLVGLALAVVGGLGVPWLGRLAAALAALVTLAIIGVVTAFVFGEDDYVGNGTSNWENRGREAHVIYIVAVTVAGLLAALYAVMAVRRTRPYVLGPAILVGGLLEAFGSFVLILAFGSN